ncbi:cell envelope-related function transcriptional attenuator common domain-containing protein [Thalassobacillus cyri]|uniref:Cell envelope-related function transcriptional attenuator common domain-containing protein n=1 Tax=Thalassobacillus cyri TaxID=571932 RepID=A0A1H4DY79_9BACI|nr:LCP family protein [Thalassobacillus cyri]SEA77458.1 cell envelope-related function transcriptional attenuator common domain-containing protein [Thalassobacillus cyri]
MKKKIKWKKIMLIFLTSLSVVIVAAGSYGWNLVTSTFTNIQEDIDRNKSDKRREAINFEEGDPFSLLLMGIDEPGSQGDVYRRTDTLILLTVNPKNNSTHMVSIPRDTYTKIVGENKKDKINHAYVFGGTEMTIRTVENFLDVPVDYFVRVDMEGLQDMINALDGVKVQNNMEFTYRRSHFKKGTIELTGEEAANYVRMRHKDPRGDLGRQERQRKVFQGMLNKAKSLSSIKRIEEILSVVEDNVRTNFSLEEAWNVQSNYKDALNKVKQHEIPGQDGEMDEVYYYMPNEDKVEKLSNMLQEHLELKN